MLLVVEWCDLPLDGLFIAGMRGSCLISKHKGSSVEVRFCIVGSMQVSARMWMVSAVVAHAAQ